MTYLEFLAGLHETLRPRTYLEVGVRAGHSLALSSAVSVGIDPASAIDRPLPREVHLVRATSDEAFARPDLLAPFAGRPIDLALIDGLHRFEYALRDFRHVEARASRSSVIVFDDVLPRNPREAMRQRTTRDWTGDVWKIVPTLARHRPDLRLLIVDTQPTGMLVVTLPDPASRVLYERYERILQEMVEPDLPPPADVLGRTGAVDPATALASPVWDLLSAARAHDAGAIGPALDHAAMRTAADTLEALKDELAEFVNARGELAARLEGLESRAGGGWKS